MVDERLAMRQGFMNDHYNVVTWSIAQFLAALPYALLGSLLFSLLFHWCLSIPVTFESFVFTVLAIWQLQLVMDGLDWIVVEVAKNAMFSVTFTMIILGSLFLFAGFFVLTPDMPWSIRWMSYMMPSKYAFRVRFFFVLHVYVYVCVCVMKGLEVPPWLLSHFLSSPQGMLNNYFHDVIFYDNISGTDKSGNVLLHQVFGENPEENKWAQVGIIWGYIALFRVAHTGMMWYSLRGLGESDQVAHRPTQPTEQQVQIGSHASVGPAAPTTRLTESGDTTTTTPDTVISMIQSTERDEVGALAPSETAV